MTDARRAMLSLATIFPAAAGCVIANVQPGARIAAAASVPETTDTTMAKTPIPMRPSVLKC
jgi:hypothetical protein